MSAVKRELVSAHGVPVESGAALSTLSFTSLHYED